MGSQGPPNNISVVIPAYNAGKYLAEAIESVLAQEPAPREIIVVNDGSTDDTAAVAQGFGQVTCLHQDNQGIAGARNTGIRAASGELLAFLDADDLWAPGKLQIQVPVLEQRPEVDMVFGLVEQFYTPELGSVPQEPPPIQKGMVCGTCLIRRASFDKVGLFDTSYDVGEFIDWYARAQEKGLVGHLVPQVLLRRRLHTTNTGILQGDKRADYARLLKAALDRRRAQAGGQASPDPEKA